MTLPSREHREAPAEAAGEARAPLWHRMTALVLKGVLPLALLGLAGWAFVEITASAPSPGRVERERLARLVEVVPAEAAAAGPAIEAWGEMRARRELSLTAEIAGRVVEPSPKLATGARVEAGERLFAIDTRDLELALAEAEAAIARIDARIAIERGQAQRAAGDLARAPIELTPAQRALVLREPQMQELEADRAAAAAARDRALLAIAKAEVRAPFDAVVVEETLVEGALLSAGTEVARLAATDAFELRLAVPVPALEWIDAQGGQDVRLTQPGVWREGARRMGTTERTAPSLSASGRMAGLIVRIPDPLEDEPEVLIGSYLRAAIEGRAVEGAVSLPRRLIRDADTVWVMGPDDRLEIRAVEVAWRGADSVLVTGGLAAGERIVATDIATVAEGMALRLPGRPVAGEAGE